MCRFSLGIYLLLRLTLDTALHNSLKLNCNLPAVKRRFCPLIRKHFSEAGPLSDLSLSSPFSSSQRSLLSLEKYQQVQLDWIPRYSEETVSTFLMMLSVGEAGYRTVRLCFAESNKARNCIIENGQNLKMIKSSNQRGNLLSCLEICATCVHLVNEGTVPAAATFIHRCMALHPWAVFLVCNLEGFVICQACINVHMVKTFKCFCHTQRALAELPFPDPLLGGCVRGVTSQPRWAFSACPAHPCSALLWGLHSHLRTDFPRFRHVDTQNFSVYACENK